MDARAQEVYDLAVNAPDEDAFLAGLKRLAEPDVEEGLKRLAALRRRKPRDYSAIAEAARKLAAAAKMLADD